MPLTVNSYNDNDATSGFNHFYYFVKAVDTDELLSEPSEIVSAAPVTLEAGLLVIDDTEDGNGTFLHPTDSASHQNLNSLFDSFDYDLLDTQPADLQISLSDLGAYSSVIWLINCATCDGAIGQSVDDIRNYIDFGGNFAFIGLRPSQQFGHSQDYPLTFSDGDIMYDYFGISTANYSQLGRFYTAESQMYGFEDVNVDTLKTPFAFSYHMFNIETIEPDSEENIVYSYGSLFSDENPFGILNGETVGVLKEHENSKTAVFSFPIYYMEHYDARDFISSLVEGYFGIMSDTDDQEIIPPGNQVTLQNYPNPFNPSTVIKCQVPDISNQDVELAIYNLKGQKIKSFPIPPSQLPNFSITWDGTDDLSQPVPSGVYFYRLKAGDLTRTSKMLLLK